MPDVRLPISAVSSAVEQGPEAVPVRPRVGDVDEVLWENLCYRMVFGQRPLYLDLHVPRPELTGGGPAPLVVWVHGGG